MRYDIAVVGGGPAGLTAAVYARRADKSVVVIEKEGMGGQMTHSPRIENFPGFAAVSGSELADRLTDQAVALGAAIEIDEITEITREDGFFRLTGGFGSYEAKTLIAAGGARHRVLGVPGEAERIGSGISFCAVCDGAFYTGKKVAMIGGGNSALQETVLLAGLCEQVTVLQNLPFLTGEQQLIRQLDERQNVTVLLGVTVRGFAGEGDTVTLTVRDEQTGKTREMAFDGVFEAVGMQPENGVFGGLTALDKQGYIVAGEDCATDTEGLFAAGDCRTKRVRQITTAAADGAVAALAACRCLDAR